MSTHWTDKRASVALVGAALRERGWKLYGWKDDRSDSMTDYYDPEHWDGVAEHPSGAVCCVDVSRHTVEASSGGVERTRAVDVGPCERCKGERAEPGGWTFEDAKADPRRFNIQRAAEHGAVPGMPDVLSPLYFFGPLEEGDPAGELHGREKCHQCHGSGRKHTSEAYTEPWPTFRQNPPNCSWHVERGGRIIAQGTGVFTIREANSHIETYGREQSRKLSKLLGRIEAAVSNLERTDAVQPGKLAGEGVTVRPGTREGFIEVRFSAKPPLEIRSELKGSGFRWAKRSRCWYGPAERLPKRYGEAPGQDQGHAPDIDIAAGY
jgi:hypothetical protein